MIAALPPAPGFAQSASGAPVSVEDAALGARPRFDGTVPPVLNAGGAVQAPSGRLHPSGLSLSRKPEAAETAPSRGAASPAPQTPPTLLQRYGRCREEERREDRKLKEDGSYDMVVGVGPNAAIKLGIIGAVGFGIAGYISGGILGAVAGSVGGGVVGGGAVGGLRAAANAIGCADEAVFPKK